MKKKLIDEKTENIKVYSFEELLETKGTIAYTNVGFSMMPLLRQRKDIIVIQRKEGRCEKYDVAFYKRGGKYILHRILKVLPNGYLIAGDNCTIVERDVTDDMILGVMTKVIRNGKTITPNNLWYKFYVHLWCDIYPLRMLILKVRRKVRWLLGGIKKRIIHLIQKDSSQCSK